jgi:lysozyme
MKMTEDGLALIRRFEGLRTRAYRCPAGVWTIGYGHTEQAGPPKVSSGTEITEAKAEEILRADVENFATGVSTCLKRDLEPAQFAALVSFAFNVGLGNFRRSSVLRAVNDGNFAAVPRRLLMWNKANGRVLPGLVSRRAAEAELFAGGATPGLPRIDPSAIGPSEGRSVTRSSSSLAAIVAAVAAGIGAFAHRGGLLGFLIFVIIAGAAIWIVGRRYLIAKLEGL